MEIKVEATVNCSPQEARELLGLPEVDWSPESIQKLMTDAVQAQIQNSLTNATAMSSDDQPNLFNPMWWLQQTTKSK